MQNFFQIYFYPVPFVSFKIVKDLLECNTFNVIIDDEWVL